MSKQKISPLRCTKNNLVKRKGIWIAACRGRAVIYAPGCQQGKQNKKRD